jgi:small subunit ribosomal protein S1
LNKQNITEILAANFFVGVFMSKDIFGDDIKKSDRDEFSEMLAQSDNSIGKRFNVGEKILAAEILSIGKDESFVSTGSTKDALIYTKELYDTEGKLGYKVGDRIDVYVTQFKKGEIQVSKKASTSAEAESLEDAFDCMLPVEGRVNEVCNGGFRIVLMGKTAFCPISQLDSKPITDAKEYVGRKYEFLITKYEEGGRNIVVSRRKLMDQQREEAEVIFAEDHKPGDLFKGMITRIEKFGAFVDLGQGVEGLTHISEIAWSRLEHPSEVVSIGQAVTVKLLKAETQDGRLKISLSIKQAGEEPWTTHKDELKVGDIVMGKVTNLMKFGAFVQVKPGIEGLVPLSEMSYTKRINRPDEVVKSGENIKVMIKEINPIDKKILLSIRDAEGDPWSLIQTKFPVGKVTSGLIKKKETFGLLIEIEEGIVGLIPRSMYKELTEGDLEHKKVGDKVQVQIADIRFEERKLTLRPPGDAHEESWQNYQSMQAPTNNFGSALGDKLKALMDKNKK